MTNFMFVGYVNLSSGKELHSLFQSLLTFAISSKIQIKLCYREKFNRCNIHRIDKIFLELASLEECAPAVLQAVAKSCHRLIPFFKPRLKPTLRTMS